MPEISTSPITPTGEQLYEQRIETEDVLLETLRSSATKWIGQSALFAAVQEAVVSIQGAYTFRGLETDLDDLERRGRIKTDRVYVSLEEE